MSRAFTMIELIFVIVILGILAAVAIPKLAATRDDANIVTTAQNIVTAASDFAAFYTSQGEFAQKIENMTNVTFPIKIGKNICLSFADLNKTGLKLKKSTDGLCKDVWNTGSLKGDREKFMFSNGIILIEN